jgi:hypothetical protein
MERGAVPQMRLALLITGFQFTEERVLTPRAEDLYTQYVDPWSPLLPIKCSRRVPDVLPSG